MTDKQQGAKTEAQGVCTCPSGDGSLRWPCPSHPASHDAQQPPAFQRWSMTKGSDGARWSVYMDHDPCGEWVKWIEVQQHCFGMALAQQPAVVGDAFKRVLASLVAAVSLLRRSGRKAAPSDTMFEQMLLDYEKAIEQGRAALTSAATPGDPEWEECPECAIGNGMRRSCDVCDGSGSVPAAQKEGNGNG